MRKRDPVDSLSTCARPWLTPRELAKAREADCNEKTIRKMIAAGTIVPYRVGRHIRIPIDEACRVFRVKRHLAPSRAISSELH